MKTSTHRIVGTGLFALDVIVRADGTVPQPSLGGSAGNVLSILGALGWKATPVGVLGDDAAGHAVQRDFNNVHADLRFMRSSRERRTPVIYQHQEAPGHGATHRFSFTCPACGARRKPHWDDEDTFAEVTRQLPASSVFFLDRPTRLGVALAERYASEGAVVVFEPSSIGDDWELFARAVRCSTIVKYSDDRLDNLHEFDLSNVVVEIQTRGARGLRFRSPTACHGWTALGAYSLPFIRDTSGAGDWCTAGMIFELFGQAPRTDLLTDPAAITRSLAFGQALSTLNCLTEGARGLLALWSADQVTSYARELSASRIEAFRSTNLRQGSRVEEPRLEALAGDMRRYDRAASSGFHSFDCCPSP